MLEIGDVAELGGDVSNERLKLRIWSLTLITTFNTSHNSIFIAKAELERSADVSRPFLLMDLPVQALNDLVDRCYFLANSWAIVLGE